jgi:hypothetical protein
MGLMGDREKGSDLVNGNRACCSPSRRATSARVTQGLAGINRKAEPEACFVSPPVTPAGQLSARFACMLSLHGSHCSVKGTCLCGAHQVTNVVPPVQSPHASIPHVTFCCYGLWHLTSQALQAWQNGCCSVLLHNSQPCPRMTRTGCNKERGKPCRFV